MTPADSPAALGDLSFVELLRNADPVVQGVMLLLGVASAVCWAIAIEKTARLVAFSAEVRKAERATGPELRDGTAGRVAARLLEAAFEEPFDAKESLPDYRARVERALQGEGGAQIRRLQSGMSFLATVGSTAPFVGLFGTVWGIMRSFTSIANAKDTSLAVVAPGIAEALFATAIGLVAAIPAVIFYNHINGSLGRIADRLGRAIERLAKRHASEQHDASALRASGQDGPQKVLTNGGMDAR